MQNFDDPLFRAARVLQNRVRPSDHIGEIATCLRKEGIEATAKKFFSHCVRPRYALVTFCRKYNLHWPKGDEGVKGPPVSGEGGTPGLKRYVYSGHGLDGKEELCEVCLKRRTRRRLGNTPVCYRCVSA